MEEKEFPSYRIEERNSSTEEFEILGIPELFARHGSDAPYSRPHIHEFYQILWFQTGSGVHHVDFQTYPIAANVLFFISPGQVHYFDERRDTQGVIIHFNESFLADEMDSANLFLKYAMFNALDSAPFYTIDTALQVRLQRLLDEMFAEVCNTQQFGHHACMQYLLHLFLIAVQRSGSQGGEQQLSFRSTASREVVRFRQLLEANYRSVHTVQEYAEKLHITPKSLTLAVREVAHVTPLALINNRIIVEAKRLLLFSDLKTNEIGYHLGFDDPSYFNKFFKRLTGKLPVAYRDKKKLC